MYDKQMLGIGEYAYNKGIGRTVQVLERTSLWGYVSYKVFDASTGDVRKVREEYLQSAEDDSRCDENFLRFIVMLAKVRGEMAEGLLTLISSGIIPLPHQIHALKKALKSNQVPSLSRSMQAGQRRR